MRRYLLIFATVMVTLHLAAQEGGTKHITVTRIDDAAIALDGELNEPVWSRIAPVTEFIQSDPDLGKPVSEKTEVRIFYDAKAIYFGIRCYDRHPEKIHYRLGEHDAVTATDSFDVLLDTFGDRHTGYYFSINSSGSQFDALSSENTTGEGFTAVHDASWDGVWSSAARKQAWGWSAEIAIPFKSLRVPGHGAPWGLNMQRTITRRNESANWVPVSRFDGTMKPSKAGVMEGIAVADQGRNLEVIPFGTVKARDARWQPEHDKVSGEGGVDLRYGVSRSLTASLAVNPDFGEAESDVFNPELSRFELFFPEKRKFFTEGSNYFVSPLSLFFSRRIGARLSDGEPQPIVFGGKLTGRVGEWTIGNLEAVTERTGFTDPATGTRDFAPATVFSVLRVQHRLLEKSAVGFYSVVREQAPTAQDRDTVTGQREISEAIDLNILHGEHITWASQFGVNLNSAHPGFDNQHLVGISSFQYDSEKALFFTDLKFLGRNTDFSNTGFEPQTDRWSGDADFVYKPFINRNYIRQLFLEINYDEGNDTSGRLQESGFDLAASARLKNFWKVAAGYSYNRVRFNQFTPQLQALTPTRVYVYPFYDLSVQSNDRKPVYFSFDYTGGKLVEYKENFAGYRNNYDLAAHARVGKHLRTDLEGILDREFLGDHRFFQNRRFLISRWNYQFTPKWRARLLAQYEDDRHQHNVNLNALLAYDFTARSAFFVGYNHQRHKPLDGADLGNEVFVKLSGLFSF